MRIDGAAAAYAAFVFDGEPAYAEIDVELEDRFDRLPEGTCDLECEQGRGDELAAFDGIDRLAADADLFGQLLLGEADDGPLDTDVILHGAGCGSVCKD